MTFTPVGAARDGVGGHLAGPRAVPGRAPPWHPCRFLTHHLRWLVGWLVGWVGG